MPGARASLPALPAQEARQRAKTLTAARSRFTAEGLTSGTRYWFRVAAVATNEQGPWGNPVAKVAP